MSSDASVDHRHNEIIIVRRGGDHEDGHHGGAWKIAFADFMTAMMCFFLVMWLINAANEQTKASVASYFNPVKLIDRNSSRKGLEEIGDGPNSAGVETEAADTRAGKEGQSKGGAADAKNADDTDVQKFSDDHLFADPYAVLAEIVEETGRKQNVSEKGDGGAQLSGPATGASGGESYRDPFAPDFWSEQIAVPDAAEQSAERPGSGKGEGTGNAAVSAEPQPADAVAAALPPEPAVAAPLPTPAPEPLPAATAAKPVSRETAVEQAKPSDAPSQTAKATAEAISRELAKALDIDSIKDSGITVMPTRDGVVISVTEKLEFPMFEIGSAVPRRDLVLAMEKIGRTVDGHPGRISVSGHTDARPYRGQGYDNWRLSSARAQSAYYMLVRGGLDEKRFKEIAGYADRELKVADDPFAAANRRIEILLEVPN